MSGLCPIEGECGCTDVCLALVAEREATERQESRERGLRDLATPHEEFDARFTKSVNEMELPAGRFRIFCPGCGSIWIQRVGAARMSVWCRFCNHAADVERT